VELTGRFRQAQLLHDGLGVGAILGDPARECSSSARCGVTRESKVVLSSFTLLFSQHGPCVHDRPSRGRPLVRGHIALDIVRVVIRSTRKTGRMCDDRQPAAHVLIEPGRFASVSVVSQCVLSLFTCKTVP